ncbi:MAG: class I tRNA ligase family protein, partial [Acidobacteria bacterium]|nr:class I tRNA ligase family protein [Acidobacteriota bacterium]
FEELGLLEKIDDYDLTLPCCERCKTVIEPLLSEQWFVKMDELRDRALDLIEREGYPRFYPEVPHKKVYTTWLENLRDWTISRQLWWGHQIPAWYDDKGKAYVARTKEEASEQAGTRDLRQDEDVLDTWFSSALWPFSTLGWTGSVPPGVAGSLTQPKKINASIAQFQPPSTSGGTYAESDLETFYPTDVLITGRDIIFLWVSRMVMTGMKFMGERPFDDVLIHGTVLDKNGQRMSKTKANGIDPLDVFEKYGVDATRMTLAGSSTGADFAWRDERVESFRNFANKIWNATRFSLLNSEGAMVDASSISKPEKLVDRWIVSRLNKTAKKVNKALETYQFHEAVQLLYHFFWDDFCDWYIEFTKDEITGLAGGDTAASRTRIVSVLEQSLRMLHPFMPFLTEELWLKLPGVNSSFHHAAYQSAQATIMLTAFPRGVDSLIDENAESEMTSVIELISKIRNIRSEMNIKPSEKVVVHISSDATLRDIFTSNEPQILKLARAMEIVYAKTLSVPKASAKAVLTGGAEVAVPLEGLIDFDKEGERLNNQLAKLETERQRLDSQLANENFVSKAPREKVDELRNRRDEIEQQSKTLSQNIAALK